MSLATATSSTTLSSTHKAYTTYTSTIPGLLEQVNGTGTVFTQHDQTLTVTVTEEAVYESLISYTTAASAMASGSAMEAGATASGSVGSEAGVGNGGGLSVGRLAGLVVGIVFGLVMFVMALFGLLTTIRMRSKKDEQRSNRERKGDGTGKTNEDDADENAFGRGMGMKAELDGGGIAGGRKSEEEKAQTGIDESGTDIDEICGKGEEENDLGKTETEGRSIEGLAELAG